MASGGMGDALTGLLATLVAQQRTEFPSAQARHLPLLAAAYLHGAAADACVGSDQTSGPCTIGLTASETIVAARRLWNTWVHQATLLDNPVGG
jgi:NAD(P)H-hydrate repair Nnr-like enzyme with NAD(P)H-hydrate dehydratase domain